ncbi:hypothetical protein K469DRAFT_590272 [Zopfia rhizophila CBS 207.26]|uniref:Uncharacterized protein n=1 Tax=Zopfia rhizophila CBS 207.26 TaxID=1314779 RepID=A0A6A6DSC1_9PEZI|nr:hypothetical protein K469DRAFT_590272 [Zopfia rhizophila CBS 207.26]
MPDSEEGCRPNPNVPIHGPGSIQHGWERYDRGVLIHWTPHSTTIPCFDLPEHLQMAIHSALASSKDNYTDRYSVLSVLFYELLSLYDSSVWSVRNHICDWEAGRSIYNLLYANSHHYPLLHEIARHVIHGSETLTVASECVKDLKQKQRDFMAACSQKDSYRKPLSIPAANTSGLLSRSEPNKARLHNEITLAFYTVVQRDTKIQVRIGKEAIKETMAMKVVAVITMTFLPATFVSSIFSMLLFHFEPSRAGLREFSTVSEEFWMNWILAAPLSIAALGL